MITGDEKYNIDNYLRDALSSKHESKPKRMIRQVLDNGVVIIGKNRYDALKQIPTESLLRSQKEQITNFEDYHNIKEYTKNIQDQFEKVDLEIKKQEDKLNQIKASINKSSVYNVFKKTYKKIYKVDFEETPETIENLKSVVLYFSKDEDFLKIGFKNEKGQFLSNPSFDKGLLIIGGFGNGKSSIMNTMQVMFKGIDGYSFGRFSSHEIVSKYEFESKQKTPELLERFWSLLTKRDLYIDDIKAEPLASAYGKKNLLNSLFQERYNKNLLTHGSCNYKTGHNGSVQEALNEFKEVYSNQVYDRLFEMFNIIEFKGKSFRR